MHFHARGLVNAKAIQNNLDWVWPFWVERQFNPRDASFIPRAFSFSHVNLTHRNWTAVGLPNLPLYPLVDPRGLVTPIFDGWSIDLWIVDTGGFKLLPSKVSEAGQTLLGREEHQVFTLINRGQLQLTSRVWVSEGDQAPELRIEATGRAFRGGWLVVSLRPYNPEGIQIIEHIAYDTIRKTFTVDNHGKVRLGVPPEKVLLSTYRDGDVLHRIPGGTSPREVRCPVGMATAAALFPIAADGQTTVEVTVPLESEMQNPFVRTAKSTGGSWASEVRLLPRLQIPDKRMQFLYDAATHTLLQLTAGETVPGTFTYRRFWFRDACLMLHALLVLGQHARVHRALATFPRRQLGNGYFLSQEGEWDSNGQVLWLYHRYTQLAGRPLPPEWMGCVRRAAAWLRQKRAESRGDGRHAGLLPAGFSAEHLGPNDFYYWDDFWGIAGLRAAAQLCALENDPNGTRTWNEEADAFSADVERSLTGLPQDMSRGGIPASPYRRMDSGAVGSLVADYPLQLRPPGDAAIMRTVAWLRANSFYEGAFFQEMVHSGINAYLSLDVAQTLLRAGDAAGFWEIVQTVASIASPTGQWPEAVHPRTHGGCMGDGQHGWAAAEWVMAMRNMFVREERDALILGSGLPKAWIDADTDLEFGPTATPWGTVTLDVFKQGSARLAQITTHLRDSRPPRLRIEISGFKPIEATNLNAAYPLEPA